MGRRTCGSPDGLASASRSTGADPSGSPLSYPPPLPAELVAPSEHPVPLLKGNLHAHTTFSDGRRPVAEVIARYREMGYGFLAITDHENRVGDDYWFNIPSGDDRLLVLPGIELDYRPL